MNEALVQTEYNPNVQARTASPEQGWKLAVDRLTRYTRALQKELTVSIQIGEIPFTSLIHAL